MTARALPAPAPARPKRCLIVPRGLTGLLSVMAAGLAAAQTVAGPARAASAPAEAASAAAQHTESAPQRVEINGSDKHDADYGASRARSATKTDTPLLDMPQAVVVVPRDVIDDQGARDLYDVARNVSGVSRQSSYWGQNTGTFRVRGFDLDEGNGYLKDGFRYFARGKVLMAGVDSVEVLKGPASVLYGRVEPGGLANLVSAEPTKRLQGELQFDAARFDQYGAGGYLSGPLDAAGRWLGRVDAEVRNDRSFRDLVYSKTVAVAPQLVWQPNTGTRVKFSAELLRDDVLADYGIPGYQGRPADVPISTYYGEAFNQQVTRQHRALLSLEHRFGEALSMRAALVESSHRYADDYDDVYSSFVQDREVVRFWERTPSSYVSRYAQIEAMAGFATGPVRHRVLLGAEAGTKDDECFGCRFGEYAGVDVFSPEIGGENRPIAGTEEVYDSHNRDRIGALYLQNELALGERWRVLLGVRHDRYTQNYLYRSNTQIYDGQATTRDAAWSPRAGLLFKLTPDVSLYASTSRSFAPAGAYYAADQGRRFEPEIGEQRELGLKWSSEDGSAAVTLAVYDLRKKNLIAQDPQNPALSIQVGEQRSSGIEIDTVLQPWGGAQLIASASRMKARISESVEALYAVGNTLPFAPHTSGSLWLRQDLPLNEGWPLITAWNIGAGAFYQGARFGDLENTLVLPAYWRFDASLSVSAGAWRADLGIDNLANRRYFDSGTGYGAGVIYPGEPRTWRVALRRGF